MSEEHSIVSGFGRKMFGAKMTIDQLIRESMSDLKKQWDPDRSREVVELVIAERERQCAKWGPGPMSRGRELSILVEEVGEVATALQNEDMLNLREELTQVAAVCVRWLEFLGEDE